jgi:hypothetical protein
LNLQVNRNVFFGHQFATLSLKEIPEPSLPSFARRADRPTHFIHHGCDYVEYAFTTPACANTSNTKVWRVWRQLGTLFPAQVDKNRKSHSFTSICCRRIPQQRKLEENNHFYSRHFFTAEEARARNGFCHSRTSRHSFGTRNRTKRSHFCASI